jgi:hypothetical protein
MTAPVCQPEGDQSNAKAEHRHRPVARSGIHSKFRAMGKVGWVGWLDIDVHKLNAQELRHTGRPWGPFKNEALRLFDK